MSKNDRFGSPFDPSYQGQNKITRPQEMSEREQHRLRGCADKNCPVCNPESAAIGTGGGQRRAPSFAGSYAGRRVEEELQRRLFLALTDTLSASTKINDSPPTSYKEARKEVEAYIVEAPTQSFDDIVGNDEALALLKDAITAPVEHKDLYEAYGMSMPKGALLSGPPGCGKTMFARAAASQMKELYGDSQEFISISGSELQSMYVGETEGRIKAIFTYAREYKRFHDVPLLVFMDEAEVLLPDRTGRVRRLAPWEESQVATFLAEMDGMQESGAFVLLATNRPEVIDQAVLRDGRCDFKIVVKRPTVEALEIILRKNFKDVLAAEPTEDLVFAALEAFQDPHKVIAEAHAIGLGADGKAADFGGKNFMLEHIVSGAMAASVPGRAKRRAFARDKASGKATGITTADVLSSVNELFDENKGLDHSFALADFKREFETEITSKRKSRMN
ncbi:AAA family ATPase [Maritalea porphyrae]|uniref:AAA family ATPase n=1 Tax=Maritalea porphyrae TaxID=880732 RepID=UPI0022B02629|nr:AAA family ATPase [Maritalea porphyrae]MCZ4270780.1 AAA family ATPase [Maritalea porphyrae]